VAEALAGTAVPERSSSMAWQDVGGEMVLLNIDGKELMGLNAVAARIWDLADGAHTVDQIVTAVQSEFAVAVEIAATDVRAFIAELVSLGAITFAAG
jgi:hypothetical protein